MARSLGAPSGSKVDLDQNFQVLKNEANTSNEVFINHARNHAKPLFYRAPTQARRGSPQRGRGHCQPILLTPFSRPDYPPDVTPEATRGENGGLPNKPRPVP